MPVFASRTFVFAWLSLFVFSMLAAPVVPGEFTDPSNIRKVVEQEAQLETPADFRFPYISTYHVKPTITTKDNVEIDFFVTDWDNSLARFGDDSFRFDVHFECITPDGKTLKKTLTSIKAGDSKFAFKPFPKGEYKFRIWAIELKSGLESHRVWHRFRVLEPGELEIPADKTYSVTAADLEKYSISNKGDLGRKVFVEVPEHPKGTNVRQAAEKNRQVVMEHAAKNPPANADGKTGYTIYVPARNGETIFNSFRASRIVYDEGYDTNAVEQASIRTADGLNRLLKDKAAEGFRKIVLLPGTYRISAARTVSIPSNVTFDLNGAVIKQNGFTGANSLMVALDGVCDAHLVNGVIEGDYYEHDYAGSPHNSEWPIGYAIKGDALYCSVENVTVREITGYGATNGQGKKDGKHSAYTVGLKKHVPGALDLKDGTVDSSRKDLFTSGFTPLKPSVANSIQISKYLGYQGVASRQWTLTCCWYDKDKKFLSSETIYQYRVVPIPEGARFLRVTQFNSSLEAANKAGLTVISFYIPQNCEIKNNTFIRCRCVGFAPCAMKNFLFEGNTFTKSGEAAAKCPFDAEDGWDGMQDVTFRANKVFGNGSNNSLLTCCGHNFIFEKNEASLYFWPRTHSPCVRDSVIPYATIHCDGQVRSGYGRFERNTYTRGLNVRVSNGRKTYGWDYAFGDFDFTADTDRKFTFSLAKTGRIVNSKFAKKSVTISRAVGCSFDSCDIMRVTDGLWIGNRITGGNFKYPSEKNYFEKCEFDKVALTGFNSGDHTFRNCTFTDCSFVTFSGNVKVKFENCVFRGCDMWNGWWTSNSNLTFLKCDIEVKDNLFLKLGAYGVGDVVIDSCNVTSRKGKDVIFCNIFDWRPSGGDRQPGSFTVRNSVFGPGISHAVGTKDKGVLGGKVKTSKKLAFAESNNKMASGKGVFGKMPEFGANPKNKK